MTALLRALGIDSGAVVSVVGAGGKTTLVYRLAAEARAAGLTALVTTTTHMGTLAPDVTGPVLVEGDGDATAAVREALRTAGRATLLGRRVRDDKLAGIAPERVDALAGVADVVLVEADGARGRSLKLPASHEPVIAAATTLTIVVAALDVLGAPLDAERVHRLELVAEALGRASGVVDEAALAAVLGHPSGYPSRIPPGSRSAVFLNKAEDAGRRDAAARVAKRLVPPYGDVLAGRARTGVILIRHP